MNLGLSIFSGINFKNQVRLFKKFGIKNTFISSENPNFDAFIELLNKNDIVCDSLHAPFDNINDLWKDDEDAAQAMLGRLKDSVDKCAKHSIPTTVVHLSSGRPMPEINEKGLKRFEELFNYADNKGVSVALENLRYFENLEFFLERYKNLGFCWDTGHEYCRGTNKKTIDYFYNRLSVLHIHDNRCELDTDYHLLPFDGKIDFEEVAEKLANSGFDGTLMLEISKLAEAASGEIYADMTDEEYVSRAVNSAQKLADMIEKYKG